MLRNNKSPSMKHLVLSTIKALINETIKSFRQIVQFMSFSKDIERVSKINGKKSHKPVRK